MIRTVDIFPDFTLDTNKICDNSIINFTDNSTSDTTIASYLWDFGDGGSAYSQNTNHTYNSNNIDYNTRYSPTLRVTNQMGCKETKKFEFVNVYKPIVNIISDKDKTCVKDSISFQNDTNFVAYKQFKWDFGNGNLITNDTIFKHAFIDTGYYDVKLTIVDVNNCEAEQTKTNFVHVQSPAITDFEALTTAFNCYPQTINFSDKSGSDNLTNWRWDFGDNTSILNGVQNPSHTFEKPDSFDIKLITETSYGCIDSLVIENYIIIGGPWAEIDIDPDSICKNQEVIFSMKNIRNVNSFEWDFGDGSPFSTNDPAPKIYKNGGNIIVKLNIQSSPTCRKSIKDTIKVEEVIADFTINTTESCTPLNIIITNNSTNASFWQWNFDEGQESILQDPPTIIYDNAINTDKQYKIRLIAHNDNNCYDTSDYKTVNEYKLPQITISDDKQICLGETITINASGGDTIIWKPSSKISDTSSYTPNIDPETTTKYTAEIIENVHNCRNEDSLEVFVQQKPEITANFNDITIVIGEELNIKINVNPFADLNTINWQPVKYLFCDDCLEQNIIVLDDIEYIITVRDTSNCFIDTENIKIKVEEKYSANVPNTFTPNGDGVNDKIFVRGWGIKKLKYFRIYNRWGEKVFETTNKNEGWDGYYKGQKQIIDTYSYYFVVITYRNEEIMKKGFINILN